MRSKKWQVIDLNLFNYSALLKPKSVLCLHFLQAQVGPRDVCQLAFLCSHKHSSSDTLFLMVAFSFKFSLYSIFASFSMTNILKNM